MEKVEDLYDEYMMAGDAIRDKYSYEEYKVMIRKEREDGDVNDVAYDPKIGEVKFTMSSLKQLPCVNALSLCVEEIERLKQQNAILKIRLFGDNGEYDGC